jgi:hypothetical protein
MSLNDVKDSERGMMTLNVMSEWVAVNVLKSENSCRGCELVARNHQMSVKLMEG